MKKVYNLIVLFSFVGFSSCQLNEEKEDFKNPSVPVVENKINALKPAEGGEPIHYKNLEKFLPTAIDGYDREAPEGAMLNMTGFSVSSATAEYTNSNKDYIRVSILDYNAAPSVYENSTAMWGKGITIDSYDEYAKSFNLSNELNGWESFEKNYNKATVMMGFGNRLLITVEANNQQNAEMSKDIISAMNLKSIMMAING